MTTQAYLEVLSREECVRLLPTAAVARIAYCTDGEVHVFPVNATVLEDEVVVRTTYGGKLAAAARGASLTVEMDELDPATRTGWVVNVIGRARLIEDLDVFEQLELGAHEPWAPGDKEFLLGISLDAVSGRRIGRPPA